jgi:putative methionine-R-sulfoxide reductase with GAF domain
MKPPEDEDRETYVRRVAEGTQRYAEDLMVANHRLRVRVAALECELERLDETVRSTETANREADVLRHRVDGLEQDKARLLQQVSDLAGEVDRRRREQEKLAAKVTDAEAESRRAVEQYRDMEAQSSNLANLYVASYRLHGTLRRQEVLDTIQEIVANLIGSEELAVFERNDEGVLALSAFYGIEPEPFRKVAVGAGLIGHCAATGETVVVADGVNAPRGENEQALSACIPLRVDGGVHGVLALFRLLPQKARIEELDRELFDLLATHASTALYCCALHATAGERSLR